LTQIDWQFARNNPNGVFHANWDCSVSEKDIEELVLWARDMDSSKARLCLHENPESLMQVTYLAFVKPYSDKIHKHPYRPEVLIPIRGEAVSRTFADDLRIKREIKMRSGFGYSYSMPQNTWHSLEVVSEYFVMIEIGNGPFTKESTIFVK
jgi:cupin fold WbuC family metalloprotein